MDIEQLRAKLREIVKGGCWEIGPDDTVNDFCGGNVDDAFEGGEAVGKVELAREILEDLGEGGEWTDEIRSLLDGIPEPAGIVASLNDAQRVGQRLRDARERSGKTLGDLARFLGVSVAEVSSIEMGRVATLKTEPGGLHESIKAACALAAPAVAQAAAGSEASIYNLRFAAADLFVALINDGAFMDALKKRRVTAYVNPILPRKHS